MAKIQINGVTYEGTNIVISNGNVTIDGKACEGLSNVTEIKITEGVVNSVSSHHSVSCGHVSGDVSAYGSVNCDDVAGNVVAGGSVNCDKVGGSVKAGGSVNCG